MERRFTAADVLTAYDKISPYIRKTPLEESVYLNKGERRYFFKLESTQTVKSFKIRGALNKILTLTEKERSRGVATVSSGNHGTAVSYAAKLLGIKKAFVIVPKNTPQTKIDRIKAYGGQVMLLGADYDEAHRLGLEYIKNNGMTYVDPYYEDPAVYAGQGTISIEILEQNPETDTIVVPIGGGGLITGIAVAAKYLKPDIRIIGVQTEACPAMIKAFENNKFYETYPTAGKTICDSLVGGIGKLSYSILRDYIDDIIEIKEKTIRRAVRYMIEKEKFVIEGGSAAAVAAVMDFPERIDGKNIALVISGGNIDAKLILEILNEKS